MPRAWQWLDGSAFPTHGELMQRAFNSPPHTGDRPLMYQGMSHRFLSASEDVPLPSEADGIDFEGEFAVTPDALGDGWRDGRVCLPLCVEINGQWFGHPNGAAMAVGFHDLIAHAALTRDLPAGTIIGSGTVSNVDHASVGSTCLSERRAIEMIDHGTPRTPFLSFGDRVTMTVAPFGRIDQRVVAARR